MKVTPERVLAVAAAVYLLGALHQYGWRYNRPEPCPHVTENSCVVKRNVDAAFDGMFWPFIAPLEFAVWATEP